MLQANRGHPVEERAQTEGVTVPHFTDPTPVPVENELLFWSDCTI